MPSAPAPGLHPTRRALLATALAGTALASTGCVASPTVEPRAGRGRRASASPSTDPQAESTLLVEQSLVTQVRLALDRASALSVPAPQQARLRALAAAHAAHADVLRGALVVQPTASPSPVAVGKDWKGAAAQLATLEASAHHQHLDSLQHTPAGQRALLLASLAVFCQAAPGSGRIAAPAADPSDAAPGTEAESLQVLLSRLRALVQGLEVGSGQLPPTDARATDGRARLPQAMGLRDQVEQWIVASGAGVPPAQLSYAMPGPLTTPPQVLATWAGLETGVLDAATRLAGSTPAGSRRDRALGLAQGQATRLQRLGVPMPVWPGWSAVKA